MARPIRGGTAFGGKPRYSGGPTKGSGTKSDPFRKAKPSKRSGGGGSSKRSIQQPEPTKPQESTTTPPTSTAPAKTSIVERRNRENLIREAREKGITFSKNEQLAIQKGASSSDIRDFVNARLRYEERQANKVSQGNYVTVGDQQLPVSRGFAQKVQKEESAIRRYQELERAKNVNEFSSLVGAGGVSTVKGGAQTVTPQGESISLASTERGIVAVTASGRDVTPTTTVPGRGRVEPMRETFGARTFRRVGEVVSPKDADYFASLGGGFQRGLTKPFSSVAELYGADPVGVVQQGARNDPVFRFGQLAGVASNVPAGRIVASGVTAGVKFLAPISTKATTALGISTKVANRLGIGLGVAGGTAMVGAGVYSASTIDDARARKFAYADIGTSLALQGVGVGQSYRNPNVNLNRLASSAGQRVADAEIIPSFGSFGKEFKVAPLKTARASVAGATSKPVSGGAFKLDIEVLPDGSIRVLKGNLQRATDPALLGGGIPKTRSPADLRNRVFEMPGTKTEMPGASVVIAEGGEVVKFPFGSPEYRSVLLRQAKAKSKATGEPSPDRLINNLELARQREIARLSDELSGVRVSDFADDVPFRSGSSNPDNLIFNLDLLRKKSMQGVQKEFAGVRVKFDYPDIRGDFKGFSKGFKGRKGSQRLLPLEQLPKPPKVTLKKLYTYKRITSQKQGFQAEFPPAASVSKSVFKTNSFPGFVVFNQGDTKSNIFSDVIQTSFSKIASGQKSSVSLSSDTTTSQLFDSKQLQGLSQGLDQIQLFNTGVQTGVSTAIGFGVIQGIRQSTTQKTGIPDVPVTTFEFPGGGGRKSGRKRKKQFMLDPSKYVSSVSAVQFGVKRKSRKVSSKFFTGFEIRGL